MLFFFFFFKRNSYTSVLIRPFLILNYPCCQDITRTLTLLIFKLCKLSGDHLNITHKIFHNLSVFSSTSIHKFQPDLQLNKFPSFSSVLKSIQLSKDLLMPWKTNTILRCIVFPSFVSAFFLETHRKLILMN